MSAPPLMEIPETIGRYDVLGVIGAGGMGVVLRARDRDSGELAAVKVVRSLKPALLARFRAEVQALSRLRHPGIVRILDQGVHDARPWFAMELLDSRTLRDLAGAIVLPADAQTLISADLDLSGDRLRRGAVTPRAARPVADRTSALVTLHQICSALAFLHGEGIVHGDLKPENVHVRASGEPVLVDLGLSVRWGGRSSREALPPVGGIAGTLAYMAPEQLRGEGVDARTDLFALGCILYEILVGVPPGAPGVDAAAPGWPPLPSAHAERIPPELDDLVRRLLAFNPRNRLGHANDVARALEVLGVRSVPRAPARPYLYRPPFAGRDDALEALMADVRGIAAGIGGITLVEGGSGIGKTRLLVEAGRRAWGSVLVLTGECSPGADGAGAFQPLRRVLQFVADRCHEGGPETTRRLLGDHGPILAEYEPALATVPGSEEWAPVASAGSEGTRPRAVRAMADTLGALAGDTGVLLLLDDLQWCDDLGVAFLHWLRHEPPGAVPVRVIGAHRPVADGDALESLVHDKNVKHVVLQPLDAATIGAITAEMLALDAAPPGLGRALAEQCEGNPLEAAEALRAAVEEGLLHRDGHGRWRGVAPLVARVQAPGALKALLARRLDELPAVSQRLIQFAALIGRYLDLPLLVEASGVPEAQADSAAADLVRRQVLEYEEGGALRFAHDALRDLARQGIAPATLPAMHHSIATALERADAPLPAWKLGALGHHWAAAGVGERARGCFLIAARAAKDRTARREAERLYRACIAVEGPPSVALADAYAGLGVDVYWALGRPADALPELERGLAIARAVGDVACEARIRSSLGLVAWSLGDFDGALAAQEAAAAAARSVGDAPAEARALVQLGVVLQARTRLGPAREALERAIALCRDAQDPRCEAQARLNLGTVLADGGDLPGAQAALWGAVELCRAVGERRLEGSALNNLAAVALLGGDYPEAAAASERALRIHRELGYPRSELIALNNLALAKNQLGDLDGARACARQALSLDVPSPPRRATCQAEIADIERRCGDYAAATALLDAAEPVLAAIGDRVNLAIVHHQRALLALATGADPSPFLDTLRASLAELGETAGGSRIAALLARVRRAVASPARLHGEAVSDLPLPLRPIQESPS